MSFMRWFRRLKLIKRTDFLDPTAELRIAGGVNPYFAKGGRIILEKGGLQLGFPIRSERPYASSNATVLVIGRNARVICKGPVHIAPGATIQLAENAELIFGGENTIAHNATILVNRKMVIGKGAAFSWNVTLIDDDGHQFADKNGATLRKFYRPLIVGEDVGLQMNVVIPRGLTIGNRAVISANTILRQDVPDQCVVYQRSELEIKHGIQPRFADDR